MSGIVESTISLSRSSSRRSAEALRADHVLAFDAVLRLSERPWTPPTAAPTPADVSTDPLRIRDAATQRNAPPRRADGRSESSSSSNASGTSSLEGSTTRLNDGSSQTESEAPSDSRAEGNGSAEAAGNAQRAASEHDKEHEVSGAEGAEEEPQADAADEQTAIRAGKPATHDPAQPAERIEVPPSDSQEVPPEFRAPREDQPVVTSPDGDGAASLPNEPLHGEEAADPGEAEGGELALDTARRAAQAREPRLSAVADEVPAEDAAAESSSPTIATDRAGSRRAREAAARIDRREASHPTDKADAADLDQSVNAPAQFAFPKPKPPGSPTVRDVAVLEETTEESPTRLAESPARAEVTPASSSHGSRHDTLQRFSNPIRPEAGGSTARGTLGPGDAQRFVQRVSRAVELAHQRGESLQIRLSPPELGSLRVEIAMRAGVLTAHLEADSHAARSALLDSLPVLRDRLAEQEIRVERFEVDVREDSGGKGRERSPTFHEERRDTSQWTEHRRRGLTKPDDAEPARQRHLLAPSGSGQLNLVA